MRDHGLVYSFSAFQFFVLLTSFCVHARFTSPPQWEDWVVWVDLGGECVTMDASSISN